MAKGWTTEIGIDGRFIYMVHICPIILDIIISIGFDRLLTAINLIYGYGTNRILFKK